MRSASVAGPRRQRRALAEELDLDAVAGRGRGRSEQAHDPVVAQRARARVRDTSGPSGTTSSPIASRWSANHSNSSGGSSGSTTASSRWPRAAPSTPPPTPNRRGAAARGSALAGRQPAVDVLVALDREAGSTAPRADVGRQAEHLEPVAPVRVEHARRPRRDRSRRGDAALVARATSRRFARWRPARRPGRRTRRAGQRPLRERSCATRGRAAVREVRQLPSHPRHDAGHGSGRALRASGAGARRRSLTFDAPGRSTTSAARVARSPSIAAAHGAAARASRRARPAWRHTLDEALDRGEAR